MRVPRNELACKAHWFEIPKPLRDEVWRAYRAGTVLMHAEAVSAAIDFLEAS